MRIDESLYKTFIEEMDALDHFRMSYKSSIRVLPLDPEDPDVRRLIEALALFSARNRLAGIRNISATRRRIFQQFFPYLLTPLPAMGVLQAVPTGLLADTVHFPKGTEIAVSPDSGGTAIFQTRCDLRILPVVFADFGVFKLPDKGTRLALTVRAQFPRNDEIGTIRFFINHLNDYETSQVAQYSLKKHIKRASVLFDEKADDTGAGLPCGVSFGMKAQGDGDFTHPLEKERLFFHFPWQELFINIEVPQPAGSWTEFTLCLDLAPDWPSGLVATGELFHLFTVPVFNLRSHKARPVTSNGTRELCGIHHPDRENGFQLHSVQGVFEVTKKGMTPIEPGILFGSAPSWEPEESTDAQGQKHHYLNLHFPRAFEEPKVISIDANWFQPWFSGAIAKRLTAAPFSRDTVGLNWAFAMGPVPHAAPLLQDDIDVYLRFLTLTNRETLNRNDLMDILQAVGMMRQNRFEQLLSLLSAVRIEKSARQGAGAGTVKHEYLLSFSDYDPALEPLMEIFLEHVETVLDVWISGAAIAVRKDVTAEPDTRADREEQP